MTHHSNRDDLDSLATFEATLRKSHGAAAITVSYLTYSIQIIMCKDMPCWLQSPRNKCTTPVTWLQSLSLGNGIITTTVCSPYLSQTTFVLIAILVIGHIECDVNVAPSYTHSILVISSYVNTLHRFLAVVCRNAGGLLVGDRHVFEKSADINCGYRGPFLPSGSSIRNHSVQKHGKLWCSRAGAECRACAACDYSGKTDSRAVSNGNHTTQSKLINTWLKERYKEARYLFTKC